MIPSGIIIGSTGGQFWPTPEMYKQHNIVYPGVPRRQQPGRDRPAIRENMLFGAQDDQAVH